MGHLPAPDKPLKVLTLDGGGLQAIATLIILNRLLSTIQQRNKTAEKPRPCDVFDVIGGIGAGGWLALFLGRFQMDITSCLTEWYSLIEAIAPRSPGQRFRRRLFRDSYFDAPELTKCIDHLTEIYGVGSRLIDTNPPNVRCKYVFVAARVAEREGGYNIFRSYDCTGLTGLIPGPSQPAEYKISSAFKVTGAARHFTPPQKETVAGNGITRFLDNYFPEPHNITNLALEEIWAVFGPQVGISVVVNIGPGLPNNNDVKRIASRFSFGRGSTESPNSVSMSLHDTSSNESNGATTITSSPKTSPFKAIKDIVTDKTPDKRLAELEDKIEKAIINKLAEHYGNGPPPYYRLAPKQSPSGTAQNDIYKPGVSLNSTNIYLRTGNTPQDIETASRHLSSDSSTISKDTPSTISAR